MPKKSISLQVDKGKIEVISPYNERFVNGARKLRGSFFSGSWTFNEPMIDYVRELMIECYGITGEGEYETCILLVKDFSCSECTGGITLFGRTIAKAYGRDSRCDLGDDIYLIKGEATAGGSVKNWKTCLSHATFEMHDVPFERTVFDDIQNAIKDGWVVIKRTVPKRTAADIDAEIESLEKRIAELKQERESALCSA